MIDNNLLWVRTIDPISEKIVKEPTFLTIAMIGVALMASAALILFLAA